MELLKKIFNKEKTIDSTKILINGKLATCIILSIVSAFIDVVFFSGLSRSDYPFFNLAIPASILLSVMSIGFSAGKFFVAMQINILKELQSRLFAAGYNFAKNFNKPKLKWNIIHKFLISISIITSMSLSVNTIGNGVRNIEQNIRSMGEDANILIDLQKSLKETNTDKRTAAKDNIKSSQAAKDTAKQEVETYWDYVLNYRAERDNLEKDKTLTTEEKNSRIAQLRKNAINRVPKLGNNIDYISKSEFEAIMQNISKSNEVDEDAMKIYEESAAYDTEEVRNQILAIADKEYKNPDGTNIEFLVNGEPINLSMAISRLQRGIMLWQSDTGDAGPSSKMFSLLAIYLKADTTAGGLGISEIMMMSLIFVFGVVQEFLIAILTPKGVLNRKTISQFSEYIDWKEFDVNRFLLKTYKDQRDIGIISSETFEAKAKKCVNLLQENVDDIIEKYSKKPAIKKTTVKKPVIDEKKIEKILEEKPKEEEIKAKIDSPKVEIKKEAPNNKLIVKSAEKELTEMINEKS